MFLAAAGRAHQAHQARHRRDLAALPPPVQRRPAHGAARPHDRRPRDLRLGPGRAAVRRLHARHRPDDPARPPGRGDRRHPPPVRAASASPTRATGSPCTTRRLQLLPLQEDMPIAVASQISPSGMKLAGKYGIGIISIGSMSTEGLTALPTQWGFAESGREEARHHGRPQELARAAQLAHRRDPREGARGGQARPDALAQRVHPRHAAAAGLGRLQVARRGGRADGAGAGLGRRHRHAGRPGEDDQERARQERRLRHLRRLRARLGQPREHLPQLGPRRALRRSPRSTAT